MTGKLLPGYCSTWAVAAIEGWSAAKLNTNMIIGCCCLWQEAAVLFANLLQELLVANPNLGVYQLCVQCQAYLQILLYASFLVGSRASASQAKKQLLPLLHKHLFEGVAQKEADEMNESGTKSVVQKAGLMSKGQSLQALVAEQRPGLNDFLFIPGPAVPPWIKNEIPTNYHEMILVENENGQMVPQKIERHVIGEIVA